MHESLVGEEGAGCGYNALGSAYNGVQPSSTANPKQCALLTSLVTVCGKHMYTRSHRTYRECGNKAFDSNHKVIQGVCVCVHACVCMCYFVCARLRVSLSVCACSMCVYTSASPS